MKKRKIPFNKWIIFVLLKKIVIIVCWVLNGIFTKYGFDLGWSEPLPPLFKTEMTPLAISHIIWNTNYSWKSTIRNYIIEE